MEDAAKPRTGGCRCGAIRYRVEGQPRIVSHCHCLDCRGTSGAMFVTWAELPTAGFAWVRGDPATFVTRPGATRSFCRDCGTQLTFRDATLPDAVDVTAGSLDGPDDLRPDDHIWCIRQVDWLHFADGLPRLQHGHPRG